MKTLYCISGLGADETAFSKLRIEGYRLLVLPWLQPLERETIEAYAARMRAGIEEEEPELLGLSFGGVISIEIAKQLPVKKVIIVSSIKSRKEMPFWMRFASATRANRLFSMHRPRLAARLQEHFLGLETEEEKRMVIAYREKTTARYTNWAINAVINWTNDWRPQRLFHIHGDQDKIFPIKNIATSQVVKGGGHFMISNKASLVSSIISSILREP